MLGMGSIEMAMAYVLSIVAALGCLVYGLIHWNDKGITMDKTQKGRRV